MRWNRAALTEEFLRRHYVDEQLSITAIAAIAGFGEKSVSSAMKRCGIVARNTRFANGHAALENALTDDARRAREVLTKEFLFDRYVAKGWDAEKIREEVGFSCDAIYRHLRRFGIQPRDGRFKNGNTPPKDRPCPSPSWAGQTKDTNPVIAKIAAANKGKPRPAASGPNHHHWMGGITDPEQAIRNSMSYGLWRETVLIRDKHTCQQCGCSAREKKLHVHHIESFTTKPELRLSVANGITLCSRCHQARHRVERATPPSSPLPT